MALLPKFFSKKKKKEWSGAISSPRIISKWAPLWGSLDVYENDNSELAEELADIDSGKSNGPKYFTISVAPHTFRVGDIVEVSGLVSGDSLFKIIDVIDRTTISVERIRGNK